LIRAINEAKNTNISPEELKKHNVEIFEWENELKANDKILSSSTKNPNEVNKYIYFI
jgi:hypothetical protein